MKKFLFSLTFSFLFTIMLFSQSITYLATGEEKVTTEEDK